MQNAAATANLRWTADFNALGTMSRNKGSVVSKVRDSQHLCQAAAAVLLCASWGGNRDLHRPCICGFQTGHNHRAEMAAKWMRAGWTMDWTLHLTAVLHLVRAPSHVPFVQPTPDKFAPASFDFDCHTAAYAHHSRSADPLSFFLSFFLSYISLASHQIVRPNRLPRQ